MLPVQFILIFFSIYLTLSLKGLIIDFKYSNNKANYQLSPQLHLYKYFYEKQTKNKIRDMYFLFVPKVQIRQKKTEDLYQFRKRIDEELENTFENLEFMKIKYDSKKVIEFLLDVKKLYDCEDFEKKPSYLCNWCEYKDYCEKGLDYMLLPKNERREVKIDDKARLLCTCLEDDLGEEEKENNLKYDDNAPQKSLFKEYGIE